MVVPPMAIRVGSIRLFTQGLLNQLPATALEHAMPLQVTAAPTPNAAVFGLI
jgi:hypothetical protein